MRCGRSWWLWAFLGGFASLWREVNRTTPRRPCRTSSLDSRRSRPGCSWGSSPPCSSKLRVNPTITPTHFPHYVRYQSTFSPSHLYEILAAEREFWLDLTRAGHSAHQSSPPEPPAACQADPSLLPLQTGGPSSSGSWLLRSQV